MHNPRYQLDAAEALIHDLQVLRRVVLADERQRPSGHCLPEQITVRQADYLTRKILTGQAPEWMDMVEGSAAARERLICLKTEVDRDASSQQLSAFFADKVLHDLRWVVGVKAAIGRDKRSAG